MTKKALPAVNWDKKLGIHTSGGNNHQTNGEYYPYEPTPYSVLCRLAESGYITKDSVLVDCGCGKGRCAIFLRAVTGCTAIGIDYDGKLIEYADRNLAGSGLSRVSFVHTQAENFEIPEQADAFFFFNPFSDVVLRAVIGQILFSWYESPRKIQLFLYYPQDEAVALLMTTEELMFVDEIDCRDLFEGDNAREKILIFEIS